ncbi:MAG TPA: peptidoglycan-binding domain-containing protein [Candidatus Limnocylindria bacterium]|nr:peptidoglycan-binding domain-containing protein [Candidatus Limnocylindria bacterium]
MIKNILKGFAVMATMLALGMTTFTSKASAATTPMDLCTGTVLKVETRKSQVFCTKMVQDMMNIAHVHYIGWQQHPHWPFVATDGDFYKQTEKAVVAYQFNQVMRGSPIAADGIVGPNTWDAIKVDCGRWGVWYCRPV